MGLVQNALAFQFLEQEPSIGRTARKVWWLFRCSASMPAILSSASCLLLKTLGSSMRAGGPDEGHLITANRMVWPIFEVVDIGSTEPDLSRYEGR